MLERCTKFENARAVLLFCSLELLFCHRLVAVAVVFFRRECLPLEQLFASVWVLPTHIHNQ